MQQIINWVKSHRLESVLLSIILLTAAFLRLYRIDEYMTFLGDEGRDAIIVRNLLVHADPILIGPGTSIGNMYLGPHYYYLSAPFLFLANFSPVGPSVMVALLSIFTVFLIWHVTREWFPYTFKGQALKGINFGALIAAFLYAISPVVITYSRSSWNPNVMPFFALLSIYSIWRVYKKQQHNWLLVTGFSLAMALNSHYLALLLIPVIGIYWLLSIWRFNQSPITSVKSQKQKLIRSSIISLLIFVFLMSPLVIFDARHNWINFGAMKKFFTVRQETVSIKPWSSLTKIIPLSEKITNRLMTGTEPVAGKWVFWSIVGVGALLVAARRKKIFTKSALESPYLIIFFWIGISIIGLSQYKQEIYDHYYGFFFPAPFILLGALTQAVLYSAQYKNIAHKTIARCLILTAFALLIVINLRNSPLQNPPNRQLQRSEVVAKEIEKDSKGREFNLTVIAERNYEGAYQYFLEKDNAPLRIIDPQKFEETVTDQLFVVCELPKEKCDPTHNPKAGIANFGWSSIESQKEIEGVQLYKLIHATPDQQL